MGIEAIVLAGLTFLPHAYAALSSIPLRILLNALVYLLMGASALVAMKCTGVRVDLELKNYKQFLIGAGVALLLSLFIAWIPALCGVSLVGAHEKFVLWKLFYELFFCFLIVGHVEELVFRVFFQKNLVELFRSQKWIGVLIAAALFGLWHWINGSWIQVLFTFGIGLVFGMTKEYLKDLHYPGIALSHGLYDFLNYIVRISV